MSTPTPSARSAGILLHPTSLPGRFGIGDLGPSAYGWVEALARAHQTYWQVLPLGPTGYGDSPYQCFSAFAGNPLLVSPELLVRDELLTTDDLASVHYPGGTVDYGTVIAFKNRLFTHVWANFKRGQGAKLRAPFEEFCREHAEWLDDFGLFMAYKEKHDGHNWLTWPEDLLLRRPEALKRVRKELDDEIKQYQFRQFLFFRQWKALKEFANERGIQLIGDIPIFVAIDSADVWAHSELFLLDKKKQPTFVAGVPPDYFSATGQLWGNPHYDWDEMRRRGYSWWIARIKATLELVDVIRLDHFLGFSAAWHIPAGKPTAQIGEWIPGPGVEIFQAIRLALGKLPLIAEDLGLVTAEVEEMRQVLHLPGMRILQFAFGGGVENRFLPHNYEPNTVVYTGTHDNDTTLGWYREITDNERDLVRRYLGRDGHDISWDMIRLAWMSVADYAIAPLQDLMGLGTEARMNTPGRPGGNWCWRLGDGQLHEWMIERIGELTTLYGR